MSENRDFERAGVHFAAKFCVSSALRALSSTNLNFTRNSWSLSRKVILHHAQDLGNQRGKRGTVGPKLFVIFRCLFEHNSSYGCLFWLSLFVVRALYHMQVTGNPGVLQKIHSKKFGTIQGLACERESRLLSGLVAYCGA